MTVPSALIAIVLVAAFSVAWWGLFAGLTGLSRSLFRTALWRLRDQVVDDVVAGRLDWKASVRDLLEAIHLTIKNSEQFTPFRVSSAYAFWRLAGSPVPEGRLDLASHGESDELREYKERLAGACGRYLFINSLFAPLGIFILPVAAFLAGLFQKAGNAEQQSAIRTATAIARRPVRIDLQAEAWAHRMPEDGFASMA